MRVVQNPEPGAWNRFVENDARGSIFHTSEMFDVFAGARGCRPRVWGAIDDSGELLALLPTVEMTVINGLLRPFTTRSVAYGGVLCGPGREAQEALNLLLTAYQRAVGGQTLFTELRNLSDVTDLQPVLNSRGFIYEPHLNYLINLARPEAEIWAGIRSNARRNISRARQSGVVIEELSDPERIPAVYAVLKDVYRRLGVPLPHVSLFASAFRVLYPARMLRILVATWSGTEIGAVMLLVHKGVTYYWYAGTLRQYSAFRAADLLVWHALVAGRQAGCTTFDFGGAGRPDQTYGVRDFKAKFGGCLVGFGRNMCVHAPLRLKISRAGYELARRFLWSGRETAGDGETNGDDQARQ